MENCIFCQIVAGTKLAYKVYEDENFLAFLDLFPRTYGHTLIIPKPHSAWFWEMDDPGQLLVIAKKLTHHYIKVLDLETCFIKILGKAVPHTHLHLIPALRGASESFAEGINDGEPLTPQVGEEISRRLRLHT